MKRLARNRDDSIFLVVGFVFLLLCTARAPYSWGEASRLATVEAMVERGTVVLDGGSFPGQADKLLTSRGMVSHKPPGLQIALTPAYFILKRMGFSLAENPRLVYRVLTLFSVGAFWLFCGYVLHRRHLALGVSRSASLLLVGSLLFGTLMLPYGLALNAHLPAGVMLLIGLLLLAGESERWDKVAAGLLFGAAFACDHAAVFFVAPALLLRFFQLRRGGNLAIFAAVVPGVLGSMLWYRQLGGTWLPLVFEQWRFDYAYSPWLLMSLTGGDQATGFGRNLFALTLGESGLFSNHPVLLFPVAGLVWQWRKARDWTAAAALLGLVLTIGYYALRSRNLGGDCFGIRWFALAVPPLGLGLVTVAGWLRRRGVAFLFALALVPSVTFAVVGARQPWMKLHLTNLDPLKAEKPLGEHLRDEFERRAAPPPDFSVEHMKGIYRANLRRLAVVTRQQARAGGGARAYEKGLEKTAAMLRKTVREPVLWTVHAELLEGAGRFTEAAEARARAEELRGRRPDGG